MRRQINYYQDVPVTDPKTGEITGTERKSLTVISNNDQEFEEHLLAVKSYCGDDYTVETLPDTPTLEERVILAEKALLEMAGEIYG